MTTTGVWPPQRLTLRRGEWLAQDWRVIDDVYVRDCYQTRLLPSRGLGEMVVDVGAHIGTFSLLWQEKNPHARFACVEACRENIEPLRANVGGFARVVHAACTYRPGPVFVRPSVIPGGTATGGSSVVGTGFCDHRCGPEVAVPAITLERLIDGLSDRIDVLKLDCEGSEYDILADAPLDHIGMIVGEFHNRERWEAFRARRFADWHYREVSRHGTKPIGIFHLFNPRPPL